LARRLASTALLIGILAGASCLVTGAPAGAAAPAHINLVKITGLIDPLNADLLTHAVHDAETGHALALVVQLNSTGGVIDRGATRRLASVVHDSPVPVTVWVGGSGRPRAYGPAYEVVRAAAFRGVGPGARVGRSTVPGDPLHGKTISGEAAVAAKVVDVAAPTLGDFVVDLDGRTLAGHTLSVAHVVQQGGQPRRQMLPGIEVTFTQLSVFPKLLHSAASPNVAYAMLIIALSLGVFEFFTAGVGVAAATAAVFGALCSYGLGVLPTRPLSVVLIIVGVLGFAVDVQAGAPRAWTVIGALLLAAGSISLYAGVSVSLWVLAIVAVLLVLFMVSGMPAMVRTRFSTPTIGRQSMVGTMGVAVSRVDPDGTVEVNGAPWRARTNRATPISAGAPIRVSSIDGLVLEVEPEEGSARDYRH
jgi:membrane-bound serine protease (ClpP class)